MSYETKKRLVSTLILIPLIFYIIFKGSYLLKIFLLICFFISIYEFYKMKINYFVKFIGSLFLIFSFYSFFMLRYSINSEKSFIFIIILLTCISTDLGGFFFGKFFGGPKFTKISPNKTYAGIIGSYILSVIVIYFSIIYGKKLFFIDFNIELSLFFTVIFISTISQLGDLTISYFKRISKIKDTGQLIPGHGGLLDRIDGMIFAFPTIYLIKIIS